MVSQESIENAVDKVGQLLQDEGLNCLINNAGINVLADFHTVTAEKMIENFHTNSVAPLMITKVMFTVGSLFFSLTAEFCVSAAQSQQRREDRKGRKHFFSTQKGEAHQWFI